MKDTVLPSDVYLDTSVVVGAIFPGTPNSTACSTTCYQLNVANVHVYASLALRLDYGRAVRRLATKPDRLPPQTVQEFRLDEWAINPLVRQRWFGRAARLLDEFLNRFNEYDELPITNEIWRLSLELMGSESLDATDSLHVATARIFSIGHFFTADSDFRRIASPTVHLIRDLDLQDRGNI